jgi:hypothetical protein
VNLPGNIISLQKIVNCNAKSARDSSLFQCEFQKTVEAFCRSKIFMSCKPSGSYATFFQETFMKPGGKKPVGDWQVSEGMLMKWLLKETTILCC